MVVRASVGGKLIMLQFGFYNTFFVACSIGLNSFNCIKTVRIISLVVRKSCVLCVDIRKYKHRWISVVSMQVYFMLYQVKVSIINIYEKGRNNICNILL